MGHSIGLGGSLFIHLDLGDVEELDGNDTRY